MFPLVSASSAYLQGQANTAGPIKLRSRCNVHDDGSERRSGASVSPRGPQTPVWTTSGSCPNFASISLNGLTIEAAECRSNATSRDDTAVVFAKGKLRRETKPRSHDNAKLREKAGDPRLLAFSARAHGSRTSELKPVGAWKFGFAVRPGNAIR
jgi:hypothetical protein